MNFHDNSEKKMLSRYTNRSVYNCPEWDRTIEQYKSIQIWLSLNRRTDYVILEKAASRPKDTCIHMDAVEEDDTNVTSLPASYRMMSG